MKQLNIGTQAGYSLISTLVGVVISLATVGVMLTTYRLIGDTSIETTQEMNRDGQALSILQVLEMEVQQSGFGTNTGGNVSDDVLISSQGKRIAWRYKPQLASAAMSCKGIEVVSTATRTREVGVYGYAINNCSSANNAAIWNATPTKLANSSAFFVQQGEVGGLSLADAVFVKNASAVCAPYNSGDIRQHPTVSLSAQGKTLFETCLNNIVG